MLNFNPDPRPYATPISALKNYVNKGYVTVHHTNLGTLIGRITNYYDSGDLATPTADFVDMEYYDPKTGNVAFTQFSAVDLSAPQAYMGPIPPPKPGQQPTGGGGTGGGGFNPTMLMCMYNPNLPGCRGMVGGGSPGVHPRGYVAWIPVYIPY